MLINYFKIAFRNLIRHKTFSSINILGLAFGIAVCSIIYLYVSYQKSYDTFNKNADNIYRLENVRYYKSGTDSSAGCVALLGPTLKEELPEVVNFTRLKKFPALVSVDKNYFNEKNVLWADSSFLQMFTYPLIYGNSTKALSGRFNAVITKNIAQKYFGKPDVIGQTIQVDGYNFKITGVAKNVPPNSHIKFDILLSYNTQFAGDFCWGCNNNNTYIQVKPGTKKSELEAKLPLVVKKLHDRQKDGFERAYFLQALTDIHLHYNLRFELEKNGSAKTVNFLSLIAILILLIAWINYINLSTARSMERAKEIGLRKVIGAGLRNLVPQFLFESFIINFIALVLSIFLVQLTFPFWIRITGLPGSISVLGNQDLIKIMIALVFISPVVAGLYPAFVLSSYSPVSILKGNFKSSVKGILLRKGLIVFQFAISIILISVIVAFNRQISFMKNKNLGFDIKQKLVVNAPSHYQNGSDRAESLNAFIDELKTHSLIEDASYSSVIPGMENKWVSGGARYDNQPIDKGKQAYFAYIAKNYIDFFNIKLVCGRNFFESELGKYYGHYIFAKAVILNESAVKEFGFKSPEKAIGKTIYNDNFKVGEVVGVMKDYHQRSLDKKIKPTIFSGSVSGQYLIFDVNLKNISGKIDGIKKWYSKMFPGNSFEYNFLDDFFNKQYKSNIQTAEILEIFTFLSIFISSLGLIGLSSLMTSQKTKEIGVRKVLGASVSNLLVMLTKDFAMWILIANAIALPAAYYTINKWLQNFAYRIEIGWWIFILAGGIALVIALATISFQAIKAATANPVEALRYE